MVGTSVRDKTKEASIAKMTASAIGMNSQPDDAAEIEERKPDDGDAQRGDERRDDDLIGGVDDRRLQRLVHGEMVSMFSIITVASSTRMPTASAKPPSVMTFIDSPASAGR